MPVDACINIDVELTLTPEQCARIHMGQRLNVFEQLTDELKDYILNSINHQSPIEDDGIDSKSTVYDIQSHTSDQAESDQAQQFEIPVDIRLVDEEGQFLGLGAVSLNGRLQPKKLIQR